MTERVRVETERHLHKFRAAPEEFNRSETYFRLLCLATVMQQDFGVRYSPNRARPAEREAESNASFFADAGDIFLPGLLGAKQHGTCASLPAFPVLYIAVGRRLGYPMKLVATRNHLFARWDRGGERWNVETISAGLVTFDDVGFCIPSYDCPKGTLPQITHIYRSEKECP